MKIKILILITLAFYRPIYAQNQLNITEIDYGKSDFFRGVCTNNDSGYVVCGYSNSIGNNFSGLISSFDFYGNPLLHRFYGDTLHNEYFFAILPVGDYYYACGEAEKNSHKAALLYKLNKSLEVVDSLYLQYPAPISSSFNALTLFRNHLALTGSVSDASGSINTLLVLTDTTLNILDKRDFGDAGTQVGMGIQNYQDSLLLISYDNSTHGQKPDPSYLCVNKEYEELWNVNYSDSLANGCQGLKLLRDGNLLIYGESQTPQNVAFNFWLTKINLTGDTLWHKSIGTPNGTEAAFSCWEKENGNLMISGYSNSFNNNGPIDAIISETNSYGEIIWQKTYGTPGIDIAYQLIPFYNNWLAVGQGNRQTDTDGLIIRTDNTGNLNKIPNTENNVGIEIFPNPAIEIITIRYPEPLLKHKGQILIMNEIGQTVFSVNKEINTHFQEIPLENLPKSVYFLKFSSDFNIKFDKFIKN